MKSRLPQGFNSGAGNMQNMIKKMQEDMATLQDDLDAREYEIKAGGGVVTININGKKEVSHIAISPEIVDPDDIETLQDIIVAAVNQAIKTVEDTNAKEMSAITGSVPIPGLF